MATIRPTSAIGDGASTIIGESVRIKGTLTGDEDLHVLGRVDGRVELQRTLVVAQSGIVKAEVSVKNAIISGVVVGNIHASESIEITKEGRMVGDVFAPRVIIVDGASFRGNVDMGDIENMPARKPGSERPRPTPMIRPVSSVPAPVAKKAMVAVTRPPEKAPEKTPPPAPKPMVVPTPMEPPEAKGLPQKANKTRVIVKRK